MEKRNTANISTDPKLFNDALSSVVSDAGNWYTKKRQTTTLRDVNDLEDRSLEHFLDSDRYKYADLVFLNRKLIVYLRNFDSHNRIEMLKFDFYFDLILYLL